VIDLHHDRGLEKRPVSGDSLPAAQNLRALPHGIFDLGLEEGNVRRPGEGSLLVVAA
jgi:hypothetical protein